MFHKRKIFVSFFIFLLCFLFISCFSVSQTTQTTIKSSYNTLFGKLTYDSTFLPSINSVIEISFSEYDKSGEFIREIFHQKIRNPKKFPLDFSVRYESEEIRTGYVYNLEAAFIDGEKQLNTFVRINSPLKAGEVVLNLKE